VGAPQGVVGPAVPRPPPRRSALEKLLALPEPARGLPGLVEVGQGPGGVGERGGQLVGEVPRAQRLELALDQRARARAQSPLTRWSVPAAW
jgi:hypothetical protein